MAEEASEGTRDARDGDVRRGWHGEPMPAGMERGEHEGEYVWTKDGAIMRWVPPGHFQLGSEDGDPDERPVRRIWLDGFYVDQHEVSWARWKLSGLPYTDEAQSRRPVPFAPDWGLRDGDPVLNVTWDDARAWARWAGKELPTEAQWEKAARGTDGRTYPWGDEPPTFERAVWLDHPVALESTAPVDCCAAGASPYGVRNMAGNVYEWVLDVYDAGFYERAPERNPVNLPADGEGGPDVRRVLRGGAYVLEEEDLRAALRYRLYQRDRTPYIGFRTVVPGVEMESP